MKKPTFLLILGVLFTGLTAMGQKTSDENFKYDFLYYPTAPMEGVATYQVLIHKGNASIDQSDLKLKLEDKVGQTNTFKGFFTIGQALTTTNVNPDIRIDIGFGDFKIISKDLEDREVNSGTIRMKLEKEGEKTKITDAEALKELAFYYKVKYEFPCILRVTDKSGKVIFAKKLSEGGTYSYGYDDKYRKSEDLKEKYAEDGETVSERGAIVELLTQVESEIMPYFYFRSEEHKRSFATGNAKKKNGYDYSELDKAQAIALKAVAPDQDGNKSSLAFDEAIQIWEKELKEMDNVDKNARISPQVGAALYHNLALAYMLTNRYSEALVALKNEEQVPTNSTSTINGYTEVEMLTQIIERNRLGYENNKGFDIWGQRFEADDNIVGQFRAKAKKIPYEILDGEESFDAFEKALREFEGKKAEKIAEVNAEVEKAMEDGQAEGQNEYEARVTQTTLQGYMLMFNAFLDPQMETLPIEICEITVLNQLMAPAMGIQSIPPEIGNLKDLKVLNLNNNKLAELPPEIGQLQSLETLKLKGNQLTSLPQELQKLGNLKKLELKDNNIPQSDIDALQKALPDCKIK